MNLTPEQAEKLEADHPIFNVMARLGAVEKTMTQNDPELRGHMKALHKELIQYEELSHLLSPEDIGILMKAQQKITGITLIKDAPKKPSTKFKKPGVEDLI